MRVPGPNQRRREKTLQEQIADLEAVFEEAGADQLYEKWLPDALTQFPRVSPAGLMAHYEFDGHFADTSGNYHHASPSSEFVKHRPGRVGQSVGLDGETSVDLGGAAPLAEDRPFTIALWVLPGGKRGRLPDVAKRSPEPGEGLRHLFR